MNEIEGSTADAQNTASGEHGAFVGRCCAFNPSEVTGLKAISFAIVDGMTSSTDSY